MSTEPDYGSLVKQSFKLSMDGNNPFVLLVGTLVAAAGSTLTLGLLGGPFAVGLAHATLKMARGQRAEIEDLWVGFHNFGTTFVAGLLVLLSFLIGFCLLFIPGLIALFIFSFTFHILADQPHTTAVDAMKQSYAMVKEAPSIVVVLWVVALVIGAVFNIVPVVGSLAGAALSAMLFATFYTRLTRQIPAQV